MVVAEQTRLAGILEDWIRSQRVTLDHVAETGGLSRNTLWLIRQGTTTKPEPETLRKIAKGLATDPHSKAFVRAIYIDALKDLGIASGYGDLSHDIPPCDLEAEISAIVKDRRRASVLAAFVRRYPNMTPGQRRLVDPLLDHAGTDD